MSASPSAAATAREAARHPAGSGTGGQFGARERAEVAVTLATAEPSTVIEQVECGDCGFVPGGDGCPYSSTCECPTCGTAAYCDGAC
mgnify:CR=1 FL=1